MFKFSNLTATLITSHQDNPHPIPQRNKTHTESNLEVIAVCSLLLAVNNPRMSYSLIHHVLKFDMNCRWSIKMNLFFTRRHYSIRVTG